MRDQHDMTDYKAPCLLMRSLLSRLSDGSLNGIGRWFTERHVADCPRCSEALGTLIVIQARLRALGLPRPETEPAETLRLHPEIRSALISKLDAVDRDLVGTLER